MAEVCYDSLTGVSYIRFGHGSQPMVVVPGIYVKNLVPVADALEKQFESFADSFTIYVIERRDILSENETVEDMAEDTANVMIHCSISNACMYGVSQGGLIVQTIASKHPELVKKAVIVSSSSRVNPLITKVMLGFIDKTDARKLQALGEDFADKMYLPATVENFPSLKIIDPNISDVDLKNFSIMARACLSAETDNIVDSIKCPVLIISGKLDKVYGVEESVYLAEKLKCRHISYENFGHAVYDENPDVLKETKDFFMSSI